jgi:hypothetical protein
LCNNSSATIIQSVYGTSSSAKLVKGWQRPFFFLN